MTAEANKTLVKEYIAALRKDKSPATVDRYVTDEDLKHHIALYETVVPGYWIEIEDLVAEGDKVAVRGTVHGVHNGPLNDIPPTGKPIAIALYIIYRIANGKIVEHWMLTDMLALLQQIGAVPAPSQG
jgi:predicted ester cyclase